ncbi:MULTISPECIES: DUF1292 domain-containing protein [Paenibacillus]|uniref:DUF1292 domain-containing protein n=2 Tax=Paenibacillus TaxID=44249 RepID=A0A972K0X2_9BACL|nr:MULTISPECIES: DUF1292 domain-containing protein [Paenibacillus]MCR8634112.1 DUF1292 domain-containing protein [Paenibacillus radicis (ex Xue et al. 2023)]NOU96084.1 DUF1292 domain-containing protein [Paenibacillus foliorum]
MYELKDLKETNRLRSAYGDDIILYDDRDQSVVYKLLSEFQLGDQIYAALQQENSKDGEPEIYKVTFDAEGEPELETIDDDDEWENVSELYDEMTFSDNDTK